MLTRSISLLALTFVAFAQPAADKADKANKPSPFTFREVMIPMRDGVHLQTVILAPVQQTAPLPILLRRTPYGVPDKAPPEIPDSAKPLMADGYIFVIQNLRGRFKSEGVFKLSSQVYLENVAIGH